MKQITNKLYYCDEGKVFQRKDDGFIMGNGLDLGDNDIIDNYEEINDPELKDSESNKVEIEHEN